MAEVLRGGITISEVLADPTGSSGSFDTDGSGRARGADEFIELQNTSGAAIDISGLELWDAQRGNWFTFPSGTVLEAGARAIVVRNVQGGGDLPETEGDDLAFDADFSQGVFNNARDNLVVYDGLNDEFIQAIYNNDNVDDPPNDYSGFSSTASRVGAVEDFGSDIDGFSIQRSGGGFSNDGVPTPGAENVCFASGTRLLTPDGYRRIDRLRPGDLVMTRDAGPQPIRWVFARRVSMRDLNENPNLRPIRLKGPGLGQSVLSNRPLRVSRQHRVEIRGPIVERMFGTSRILAPAKDLLGAPGVSVDDRPSAFHYFHVLLDRHHVLNADGFAAESLFMGPMALTAMSADALAELDILFPHGVPEDLTCPEASPHHLVRGKRVRQLMARHVKNDRPLELGFPTA